MNRFCTLFDASHLTRGLALHQSLVETREEFLLLIYCFDDEAYDILEKMRLPSVRLVRLRDFETTALLGIKSGRTRAEYCWTCTPWVIRDALDRFDLPEVTYIDADLYFFSGPSVLLAEFHASEASVLITEHRYTPEYDQSKTSGIYCVQFVTFIRNDRGLAILEWWGTRCIEWCFARFEDGKFGDQKYLDDWTTRFAGDVHVLEHVGGGVAPWNVQQYEVTEGPRVNGVPVVFYHFHALKWWSTGHIDPSGGWYRITRATRDLIYRPYARALERALERVRALSPGFRLGLFERESGWRGFKKRLQRRMEGNYPVIPART